MFGWRWLPIHRRACVETVATVAKAIPRCPLVLSGFATASGETLVKVVG